MINEQDALLSAVQANYYFGKLRVVQDRPLLVETERGRKKIRIWQNEALLKLHLKWRERLINDAFFIDRMYVTRSGLPSIRIGRFSVTCHDAPSEPTALEGNEALWASVVGQLVRHSRDVPAEVLPHATSVHVRSLYEQAKQIGVQDQDAWKIISACFSSACARAKDADRLREPYQNRSSAFILPEDFSGRSCSALFDTLFLELGQSRPVDGCGLLARFFMAESMEHGKQSMNNLFQALKNQKFFDRETIDLLQAEWLEPDEWMRLLEYGINKEQIPQIQSDQFSVREFKQIWDRKVKLIHLFNSVFTQSEDAGGGAAHGADGQQSD
ncbi:hypothetical protein NIE88_19545 [Sporolactobacillus shoreicorticis]|uniref:Helicase Helix-turn-helix domain-containing protein n=1 Tax=Sporolactobacillus shoreicorticis TaxID=1923877 RepID=A0ABW5RXT9_9BACL|nr:hypothetical protein [Sporolactobacillus shoreicorticis]MCO7127938.1 hypothetical protein [Sporolactobacillus shoreicorticis]